MFEANFIEILKIRSLKIAVNGRMDLYGPTGGQPKSPKNIIAFPIEEALIFVK